MDWELEQIAAAALEANDVRLPVNPDVLAHRLSLVVKDGGPGCNGLLLEELGEILVDERQRRERRAFAIAHEIAHLLLRLAGLPDTERAANYIASALLLPRYEFDLHLKQYGWDLIRLHAIHRWASFEAIARRIVALRPARAFVFDKPLAGDKRPGWYSIPDGLRPSRGEWESAGIAAREGAPVMPYSGLSAWPVLEHDWHRVITLSDAEAHAFD